MFASIELARRIETAEARMMASFGALAQGTGKRGTAVCEPIDGGVAVFVRPDCPMNKVIGLGFHGPLDPERLAAIERQWSERGASVQVELSTLARCEVAAQLAGRGYELRGFENVLGCAPADHAGADRAPAGAAGFAVECDEAIDRDAFVECVVDGFVHGDDSGAGSHERFERADMVAALRESMSVPGMHRYGVRVGGVLAGGASMHLDPEGVAQLCGAATVPSFRRQGIQSAMLRARLAAAARARCDVAVITTVPGSKSQANAQRQGFSLLYARAILVKAPGRD